MHLSSNPGRWVKNEEIQPPPHPFLLSWAPFNSWTGAGYPQTHGPWAEAGQSGEVQTPTRTPLLHLTDPTAGMREDVLGGPLSGGPSSGLHTTGLLPPSLHPARGKAQAGSGYLTFLCAGYEQCPA